MTVITYIFFSITIIQIAVYVLLGYKILSENKAQRRSMPINPPISVIVCAHNEEKNLTDLIPKILNQEYPIFELIVVNDRSTDGTISTFNNFTSPQLQTINISKTPRDWNSKKYALKQGVSKAKYDWVLVTDADCLPASNNWIKSMANHIHSQTEIVLSAAPINAIPGFLNQIIQFETFQTSFQFLGLASVKHPYMGLGRNMLYKKNLIETSQIFDEYKSLTGGDDDLLINEKSSKNNTSINIDNRAFCYSNPKETWKKWLIQKIRHLSVGKHYKTSSKLIISLLHTSTLLFYACSLYLIVKNQDFFFTLILFSLRTLTIFFIFDMVSKKLGCKIRKYYIIVLDVLYMSYIWTIGPLAMFLKRIRWS